MAGGPSKAEGLESLLRSTGAHLHPGICIAESEASGLHWRAKEGDIASGSTIISAPHSMALSYLNALVDEDWPIFKQCRQNFKPDFEVEAISFFYLIVQYINRGRSFWKPYLDALPAPDEEHTQPLFYKDQGDIDWLAGTDVWHTNQRRISRYREIYEDGKSVLRSAGHDGSWCTWKLFKWAAATFTSRSFSSRALRPHDSKYWAAYRHDKDGRSQTVLIDMSHASASDFPVLFPGLDIGNHSNDAKIDYIFDPGRFEIKTNTATAAGAEVFNNYGPKGNDELLLGYGFCIPENPHSSVSLTLKTPSETLQQDLRIVHPGYFRRIQSGDEKTEWNAESATVQISGPGVISRSEDIFQYLPEPLLELLIYVLRFERGHPFAFIEHPREYLDSVEGKRYLPHIANILLLSLLAKLQKLPTDGFAEPMNARQRQAAIYRNEQRDIIISVLKPLKTYLQSLVAPEPETISQRLCLVRLETFLELCQQTNRLPCAFIDGIEANTNTRDIEQLRLAGWEEDIWILLLVALAIADAQGSGFFSVAPAYMHMNTTDAELARDPDHPSHSLLQLVRNAADACPGSIWTSPLWTLERLCQHAKRLEFDGFLLPTPSNDDERGQVRFCIYLHNQDV